MVKIIKPGKIRIITCPRCDCQFSFEDEDVKYGNQRDYFEEVICPCCHKIIDLIERKKEFIDNEFIAYFERRRASAENTEKELK